MSELPAIIKAIHKGDITAIRECISRGDDVTVQYNMPIRYCRDAETLKMLINAGADVDSMNAQIISTVERDDLDRAIILINHNPSYVTRLVQSERITKHIIMNFPEHREIAATHTPWYRVIIDAMVRGISLSSFVVDRMIDRCIAADDSNYLKKLDEDDIPTISINRIVKDSPSILKCLIDVDRFDVNDDVWKHFIDKRYFGCLGVITATNGIRNVPMSDNDVYRMIAWFQLSSLNKDYSFLLYAYLPQRILPDNVYMAYDAVVAHKEAYRLPVPGISVTRALSDVCIVTNNGAMAQQKICKISKISKKKSALEWFTASEYISAFRKLRRTYRKL